MASPFIRWPLNAPKKMTAAVLNHLVSTGAITQAQADVCITQHRHQAGAGHHSSLNELVIRNRFAHPSLVADAEAAVHGVQQGEQSDVLPPEVCTKLQVVPVRLAAGVLTIQAARKLAPSEQRLLLSSCSPAAEKVSVIASDRVSVQRALAELTRDVMPFTVALQRLRTDTSGPALRLALDALLAEAVRERASDIHLDKVGDPGAWVAYRIDGELVQRHLLPARLMAALVTRIKTEAGMDASNQLHAQDGRLSLRYQGRNIDYRVNAQPIAGGETLALRVLDAAALPSLEDMLPAQEELQEMLRGLVDVKSKRGGIVLVTGVTGSGKSTTLAALTALLPRDKINLMTVENPVEYVVPFARQIQLNDLLGQEAGDMERSLLRQDPDVIMLGEIRDITTARAALKFAESGHLVLATLHADSATATFERLAGFFESAAEKAQAVQVLSQLLLVSMNQTLMPRLCTHCAVPSDTPVEVGEALIGGAYRRLGCNRCNGKGTRGRALLHETLAIPRDGQVRAAVQEALASGLAGAGRLGDIEGVRHVSKRATAEKLLRAGVVDMGAVEDALG